MTTLSACVFVAQVAQYLGSNGTERALKEFNNARDSLIWIRDFFQNQLHSFLIDDVHMLKLYVPTEEEIKNLPHAKEKEVKSFLLTR